MNAVVKIKDKQYKVQESQKLIVDKLDLEDGAEIAFSEVLFVKKDDGSTLFGTPLVDSATVTGKVIKHFKGDKIVIFKKKRRKGYKKKQGHRQDHCLIQIEKITV